MKPLFAGVFALLAVPVAAEPVIVFPPAVAPAPLALDVTAGGKSPEAAWAAFLDMLFDHFDRDADRALSAAEFARVIALPADGRAAKPDFAALDADKDAKPSRAEFRAGWRAAGFAPVVVAVRPAVAESLRLGHALFHHFDRDANGTLSAAELRAAASLLRRLDDDEDEVLAAAELLAIAPAGALTPAGAKSGEGTAAPQLRIPLGDKVALDGAPAFRLSADGARLTVPGGMCALVTAGGDPAAAVKAACGCYAAQFQAAAGDRPAAKAAFADDPTAQVRAERFDPADRDGDGKLTRAELDAFFDLIEAGVTCRVVATLTDRGRNLHVVGPGTTAVTFGPVPLGAAPATRPVARVPVVAGPRWFVAMDRNRDGYVSAAEFTGPPTLFTTLDRDRDGRLSPEEAAADHKPR